MHGNHTTTFDAKRVRKAGAALTLMAGIAALGVLAATPASIQAASAFSAINEASIPAIGERLAAPEAYSLFRADLGVLAGQTFNAPLVRSSDSRAVPVIELPMPDGSMQSYRVYDSPVMAPALAAQFPEIRTFELYGQTNASAFGRMSLSSDGLHATVWTSQGSIWIDPYQRGDLTHYSVCWGRDYHRANPLESMVPPCETEQDPVVVAQIMDSVHQMEQRGGTSTGDQLRTYRMAIGATGEYTAFHGGTVPAGMAAIVTAMNRVNGVFQREFSIFGELVANNSLVVYTNSGTDPYTNNNGSSMLGQNQSTLDSVIGSANYDFGHVFSTGGGGIAQLNCVCINGAKARGVTGLNAPTGDNFYIDYVAHEMGHQLGATHSFNSVAGACGGGNRTSSTAYEPGSGTTIMGYAGICGADNIQQHSDDYYHLCSWVQIRQFTESGGGNGCPVTTATGNTPPVADANIGGNYTIPLSTPFQLTGGGQDDDDDPLTYCWEEYDLGPAGPPNAPTGNAPIFRSFDPATTPTRIFPRISDIVNNTQTKGEIKPSYARNLVFRLTVRDNLGGVNFGIAQTIAVAANGPFLVTSPNTSGIQWGGGSAQTVTWDVAGTSGAPVNCANVNILMSDDGGFTYPYTLLTNTPNDGSQSVIIPVILTTTARIKVEAVGNVFFDISNANFEITATTAAPEPALAPKELMLVGSEPNPTSGISHIRFRLPEATNVSLKVYSASGREVATLAQGTLEAGEWTRSWDGLDYDNRPTPAGVYWYRLSAGDRVESKQLVRVN